MRLFSRPSHYQVTFIVLFLGIAWGVSDGQGFRDLRPRHRGRTKARRGFVEIPKRKPGSLTSYENRVDLLGRVLGETRPLSANFTAHPLPGASSPKGKPLAKVKLELVPLGKGIHARQGILSVFSGKAGEFRFEKLLPGRYMLRALPRDREHLSKAIALEISGPGTRSGTSSGSLAKPGLMESSLLLPLPRNMLGKLVAKDPTQKADQDMKGFWVSVSENGLHRGTAQTDPRGEFQLKAVGTGPYEFTLRDQDGEILPVQEASLKQDPRKHRVLVSLITP